jgi:hypothetical protein
VPGNLGFDLTAVDCGFPQYVAEGVRLNYWHIAKPQSANDLALRIEPGTFVALQTWHQPPHYNTH